MHFLEREVFPRPFVEEGNRAHRGWSFERPALATLDEILHAERLRLRLRERFPDAQARCVPPGA